MRSCAPLRSRTAPPGRDSGRRAGGATRHPALNQACRRACGDPLFGCEATRAEPVEAPAGHIVTGAETRRRRAYEGARRTPVTSRSGSRYKGWRWRPPTPSNPAQIPCGQPALPAGRRGCDEPVPRARPRALAAIRLPDKLLSCAQQRRTAGLIRHTWVGRPQRSIAAGGGCEAAADQVPHMARTPGAHVRRRSFLLGVTIFQDGSLGLGRGHLWELRIAQ